MRKGDIVILAGAAVIAWYEKTVVDDEDLISNRVAAYRRNPVGRVVVDAIILATALHLAEWVGPEHDIYHHAMRYFRRNVAPKE